MFNDLTAREIVAAAKANGIEDACLLALVEIETGGKTFEEDGRTPRLLYERHVAYREAKKKGVLNAFLRSGLAIPHLSRSTQYKDEGTSARRLALIAKARAIDPEVADRSASWGLGQTMGFNAEETGFENAQAMVAHQTGSVSGQIDCMIRELRHSGIVAPLNAHEWTTVARKYNGPGYAQNRYDSRLRDAYARWKRRLPQISGDVPPEQELDREQVRDIQRKLRDLGFHEVGAIDGLVGTKFTGAISAFQAHQGLAVTGHYDAVTRETLNSAEEPRQGPIKVRDERQTAGAEDLRKAGSDTIRHADDLGKVAKLGKAAGVVLGAGAGASQTGMLGDKTQVVLDKAQTTIDQVQQAKGIWSTVHGWVAPILHDPATLIIAVALFVVFWAVGCIAKRIIDNRVADHRSGVHAGPEV